MKRCKKTEMQRCGHWENGFCSAEKCSYQIKSLTNFERIKNMTIEEMAQTINDKTYGCVFRFGCPCDCGDNYPENCVDKITEWLESDFEEDHPTEKGGATE